MVIITKMSFIRFNNRKMELHRWRLVNDHQGKTVQSFNIGKT